MCTGGEGSQGCGQAQQFTEGLPECQVACMCLVHWQETRNKNLAALQALANKDPRLEMPSEGVLERVTFHTQGSGRVPCRDCVYTAPGCYFLLESRSFTCRLQMPSRGQSSIGVLFLTCTGGQDMRVWFLICIVLSLRLQMGAGFYVNDVSSELVRLGNIQWGTELKACAAQLLENAGCPSPAHCLLQVNKSKGCSVSATRMGSWETAWLGIDWIMDGLMS